MAEKKPKFKEYEWLEDEDKCPHCGSKDVIPVHPFDYIKHCMNCDKEFAGSHN